MGKVIAAINMTIDGFCDHTSGVPDEEVHQHYSELLEENGIILYGRTTYELMKYWQTLLSNPSGEKAMDDFAVAIDKIPKMVFSQTLKDTGWDSASLSDLPLKEKVLELKKQSDKNILAGSRSIILQLLDLGLIDEFQLCIHPVVAGGGLPLFENVKHNTLFNLNRTKTFSGGAVILYLKPPGRKD